MSKNFKKQFSWYWFNSGVDDFFNHRKIVSPDGYLFFISLTSLVFLEIEVLWREVIVKISQTCFSLKRVPDGRFNLIGCILSIWFIKKFISLGLFLAFRGGKRGSFILLIMTAKCFSPLKNVSPPVLG
jgi:hypothetical protein